jgi:serine phosphatase RsbU (regulator of sigma subunit)
LAIGQEKELQPESNRIPVALNDRVVLSTDGLTGSVTDS